ncbi:GTP:adenosylcobinamide-phosphate guanylyltransferase-like protein [Vulcanisaeta moutnovskia 768-28]|uniref:GTP:adenosylcobinamide-phosphate guanylyltransferase-like protein n=1 Tax=Vulcanisaeta moutnovskia (strain 768-28) TaxID=985053 RepID=F0QUU3_VULM7|nr:GTP--adenosylcobinamide-phosphate guanylyltransferase [Vulcanisaeta moutnovskia]ADY01925.1 GTP:adenosylcobinamide-phosphate guanylyltransferase-like protein [Vulcanisaeta moutnovskia 768-28]
MNVIIMAGGAGTRLSNPNKPLIEVCGKPMIMRVIEAVEDLGAVYIATTIRHSSIIEFARNHGYKALITGGKGYPEDFLEAINRVGIPALIVPADMPFLNKQLVRKFLIMAAYVMAPMITLMYRRDEILGFTGISLVRRIKLDQGIIPWVSLVVPWSKELLNINTPSDINTAQEVCENMSQKVF